MYKYNSADYKAGAYTSPKECRELLAKRKEEIKALPAIVSTEKTQIAILIALGGKNGEKYNELFDNYKKIRNIAINKKLGRKPLILKNEFMTLLTNIDLLIQFNFLKIIRKLESKYAKESAENIKRLLEIIHFYNNLLIEVIELVEEMNMTNYPFQEIRTVNQNGYGISKNAPEGLISTINTKYHLPNIKNEDRVKRIESVATKRAIAELHDQLIENYRKRYVG